MRISSSSGESFGLSGFIFFMEKRYNPLPDKKKNAGCHMCHMKIYLVGVCITDLLGNLFVIKNLLDYAQELC